MPDSHDLPPDDRERMQRYLEWRERTDRADGAVRRRSRQRGALVGVALGAIAAIGLTAWLLLARPAFRETTSTRAQGSPTAGVAAPSVSSPPSEPLASPMTERPSASEPPQASEPRAASEPLVASEPLSPEPRAVPERRASVRRTARSTTTQQASRAAAAPTPQPSPSTNDSAASATAPNERSAPVLSNESTRTAPATPNETAAAPPAIPNADVAAPPRTAATTPNAESAATPLPSRVDRAAVTTEPDDDAATARKRACADVMTADDGVRARSQRAVDCAGRWLKGEADEFRGGVKRQLDNVRDGLDKVGRGLQSLGDKLRRP